ncbi:hypothetical protein J010_04914 [Cryptococcus neoformans]|nr:hypothetical protein C355_04982 [Cryptococcus neoformans var. grubii Th84]OXH05470.1 hypothetical protein J010_04914 [Cryptococcus neoformans var. grubii]OXH46835.1 hypothetical protein J004_04991 [Cryptococcus neoformans var. grubii]
MTLLSSTVQPPLLSLLSSTSSPALSPLFIAVTDPCSSNSVITTVDDSQQMEKAGSRVTIPKNPARGSIADQVIHIQSPDLRRTYIQAGCSQMAFRQSLKGKERDEIMVPLGVELPWIGMQVKRLSRRDLSFEVGVIDSHGREGVIRCSSYKHDPSIHPHRSPPLIHLPLSLSSSEPFSELTPWRHIELDLSSIIPLFQSLARKHEEEEENGSRKKRKTEVELPNGGFGSVSYVRVYANCRIRRIWFTSEGEKTLESGGKSVRDEWALHAAQNISSL